MGGWTAAVVLWLAVSLANLAAFGHCNIIRDSTLDILRQATEQKADLPQLEMLAEISSRLEEDLSAASAGASSEAVSKHCRHPELPFLNCATVFWRELQ